MTTPRRSKASKATTRAVPDFVRKAGCTCAAHVTKPKADISDALVVSEIVHEPTCPMGWADRIRPHLAKTVEGIVGTGRELTAAKAALPHGRWLPMLERLDLSPEMARRFMRVAAHPALANRSPATGLPSTLTVLDVLARLAPAELTEAVEAGEVTPSTTRTEAEAVVRQRATRMVTTTNLDGSPASPAPQRRPLAPVVPIGPAAERKAQQHERDLQRAVDDATASGDPVATYKALEQHAQWLEVMAAWYRLRAGLIEVFRRYEGQTTDEGDTVTVETFADHAGIPVETFRRWLGES